MASKSLGFWNCPTLSKSALASSLKTCIAVALQSKRMGMTNDSRVFSKLFKERFSDEITSVIF